MIVRRFSLLLVFVVFALGLLPRPGVASDSTAPPAATAAPDAQSSPIVLDLVVRDKKNALVEDLRAEEVELYDDGVRQDFEGFRRVAMPAKGTAGAAPTGAPPAPDRLVVFLFPKLQGVERDLAKDAAEEFVKKRLSPGMALAVLLVGPELVPIQGFTKDAKVLKEAIERSLDPDAEAGAPDPRGLFSLVRWLEGQPGRKTVLLFSSGLAVPPGFEDSVADVVGLANQQRITFYGIDPRGIELATKNYQQNQGLPEEVWLRGQSQVGEDLRGYGVNFGSSVQGPSSQALAKLAEGTGGVVLERTNSFSKGMRQIAEDVSGYYELTYTPDRPKSEGQVRRIEVRVTRTDATVQARQQLLVGEMASALVPAFEKGLAEALAADPLPSDLEVFDRALQFGWDGEKRATVLWVAVPLDDVALAESDPAGRFEGDLSILARVKDASGKVVGTFSQRFPLGGPAEQMAQAHAMSIPFVRRLKLAPGTYSLETAVQDGRADKLGAHRKPFEVEAPQGIAMSSLSLSDLLPEGSATDPDDPLSLGKQRLIPNIGQPIKAGQSAMTLYSVIYPEAGSKEKAQIAITLLLDRQPVNHATAVLPAPDASGKIPYSTALRMDVLPPGTYRFKVAATQGSSRAEESVAFTIVP